MNCEILSIALGEKNPFWRGIFPCDSNEARENLYPHKMDRGVTQLGGITIISANACQ